MGCANRKTAATISPSVENLKKAIVSGRRPPKAARAAAINLSPANTISLRSATKLKTLPRNSSARKNRIKLPLQENVAGAVRAKRARRHQLLSTMDRVAAMRVPKTQAHTRAMQRQAKQRQNLKKPVADLCCRRLPGWFWAFLSSEVASSLPYDAITVLNTMRTAAQAQWDTSTGSVGMRTMLILTKTTRTMTKMPPLNSRIILPTATLQKMKINHFAPCKIMV